MVDLLQMIFEVLRVQDLASQYYSALDQFLYVLFFPSIFIILIVYMIAHEITKYKAPTGFSMMLGVAIYIFIVVWPPNEAYSLYSMVAPLGQIWFILIIVLVGIGVMLKTLFPGGDEKGGGGAQGLSSGLGKQLTGRLWKQATGQISDLEKMLNSELQALKAIANKMKHAKSEIDYRDAYQAYPALNDEIVQHLKLLRDEVSVAGGMKLGATKYNKFMKEFQNISADILKFEKKKRK